jgi:hypothetical protein
MRVKIGERIHNSLPLSTIFCQLNQTHTFMHYLFSIILLLPSHLAPSLLNGFFPFSLPINILCALKYKLTNIIGLIWYGMWLICICAFGYDGNKVSVITYLWLVYLTVPRGLMFLVRPVFKYPPCGLTFNVRRSVSLISNSHKYWTNDVRKMGTALPSQGKNVLCACITLVGATRPARLV